MRWIWILGLLVMPALPAGANGHVPPLAPVGVASELRAIGHVTPFRPAPGAREDRIGCTGTLISPTQVLTAAHCVARRIAQPQNLYVTFGWRADGPPLFRSPASRIRMAEGFSGTGQGVAALQYDLALISLPRPVPSELIAPIQLASDTHTTNLASYGFPFGAEMELRGREGCSAMRVTGPVLGFDCPVIGGFSGSPLLSMSDTGPTLVAVTVARAQRASENPSPIRSYAVIPTPDFLSASE